MFYLELVTDMLHLLVYVIFFIIVFTNYGLPLHLVRRRSGPTKSWRAVESLSAVLLLAADLIETETSCEDIAPV